MTIDAAIAELEAEFGSQAAAFDPDLTLNISSGDRIGSPIDAAPVLCLNRELAVSLWLETARAELRRAGISAWRLQARPTMDLWRITIADARQTHRIAAARFSVVGTIEVRLAPKEVGLAGSPATVEIQEDADGLFGRGGGGSAAATDGFVVGGGGGADAADAPGAGRADGRPDADRGSAAADAAAGPAVAAADQP